MVDPSWVLSLMLAVQPSAPWRATYESTAEAIAWEASASPAYGDEYRTAAVLVSLAWFESTLQPDARGDCTLHGAPSSCAVAGAVPHSFCLMQIHESNLAGLHTTRAEVQSDVRACVRAGLSLVHTSLRVCRAAPVEERLRWYAGGGAACPENDDARRKAKHRFLRARALLAANPPPKAEP